MLVLPDIQKHDFQFRILQSQEDLQANFLVDNKNLQKLLKKSSMEKMMDNLENQGKGKTKKTKAPKKVAFKDKSFWEKISYFEEMYF